MNKEQILKYFSELYIGQNPRQLTEQYLKKKKKEMFFFFLVAMLVVVASLFADLQNSNVKNNRINRKEVKGKKAEIVLQMKTEDKHWKDIVLELYPKEYSLKELENMFEQACIELPELIRRENRDLKLVESDLNLVQEMTDFPFCISWRSSKENIINEDGKLLFEKNIVDEEVELTAIFSYEDWEKEFSFPVHIQARKQEDFVSSLEESLREKEKQTRMEEEFYLPDNFKEDSLQWRYPPGNSSVVLSLFFIIVIPLISYQKDQEICNQTKIRKKQIQESFPEFISKLILLLEAGMSIKGAFFRISEDYQQKCDEEKNYLYEELLYVCRQMKNGLSEKEGYEILGKRCGLSCYRKLSGLLIQHLQKGGNGILESLRQESVRASEEQKRGIQRKGEEMGTKLLIPMILMLAIVMIFIMVPALFSFQI